MNRIYAADYEAGELNVYDQRGPFSFSTNQLKIRANKANLFEEFTFSFPDPDEDRVRVVQKKFALTGGSMPQSRSVKGFAVDSDELPQSVLDRLEDDGYSLVDETATEA